MVMSAAIAAGQSGQSGQQPTPQPARASSPAARPQSIAPIASRAAQAKVPPAVANVATQRALVDQYCVTCHNARLKTADLLLDELDLSRLGDHAEIGEKVVSKLRAGLMPTTDRSEERRVGRARSERRGG